MQRLIALSKASVVSLFAAVLAIALAGCATPPQTAQLLAERPATLPVTHQIPAVPFFEQDALQCGPASLAMVLNHWGKRVTPQDLTPQMFLPGREGSLQLEVLAASRRGGMLAVPLAPTLLALLAEVAAGHPVIVLQNLSLPIAPVWHYAVVTGYDLNAQTIVLHSGPTRDLRMSLTAFENTWARSAHWSVTVVPPTVLPVSADETAVLAAAAALERTDKAAAAAAYRTALARWPASSTAWIGLGNLQFAQQEHAQAAASYERAVKLNPDAADGWHNLAWAYQALGDRAQAIDAAQRAVTIGGVRLSRYQESLKQLRTQ
jgi:hypothetical protein